MSINVNEILSGEQRYTWVFTGDSITHGALHTFGYRDYIELFAERWRYELRRVFDTVINTGVNGWNVPGLRTELEWAVLRHEPQIVSINLGMNDCGNGAGGLAQFQEEYLDIIATIRAQTSAHIILHTPNGIDPNAPVRAAAIGDYVEVIREIAATTDCLLVDNYAQWQTEYANILPYILSDAIHPNEYGHRAMAHLFMRTLDCWDENSNVCRLFVPAT